MNTPTFAKAAFLKRANASICVLVVFILGGLGRADIVVVPGSLSDVEGNLANFYPFFIEQEIPARFQGMRYQQVYNASEFTAFEPGGGRISALWFRWDHEFPGPGTFITNIQINLSTTSKSADNLSMVFSENVGPDDRVVIGPGPLEVTGGGGGASPSPFTIRLDLDNPFDYNPSAGNLLLDVRNYTGGRFNQFQIQALDAQDSSEDGISRLYAVSVNALVADDISFASLGLVTQFEFTPIPEPSSLTLIGLVGVLGGGWAWARGSTRNRMRVEHNQNLRSA